RGDHARKLRLQFYVNEQRRTQVELKVDKSWSYRTWAYNTLLLSDKGTMRLEITDDQGDVLADTSVQIGATGVTKPYVKKAK
ncbi:MAG: DUF2914 domain-containing protein, partial [Polyangiaceae bacterium]|nr:DUF2914 domain-containing protein [Polyangiaceae bacterium]